jgi:hypothetical protein
VISAAALAELKAEAAYAAERLALYRRRMLMGKGEPRVLAERERAAAGAAERLKRARREND